MNANGGQLVREFCSSHDADAQDRLRIDRGFLFILEAQLMNVLGDTHMEQEIAKSIPDEMTAYLNPSSRTIDWAFVCRLRVW
jgi:hypothetical protein